MITEVKYMSTCQSRAAMVLLWSIYRRREGWVVRLFEQSKQKLEKRVPTFAKADRMAKDWVE